MNLLEATEEAISDLTLASGNRVNVNLILKAIILKGKLDISFGTKIYFSYRSSVINALDKLIKSKKVVRMGETNNFHFTLADYAIPESTLKDIPQFFKRLNAQETLAIHNESIEGQFTTDKESNLRIKKHKLERNFNNFTANVEFSSNPKLHISQYMELFFSVATLHTPLELISNTNTPHYLKPFILKYIA